MGVFEDTMQGLLEAIEMEHGEEYRKEVELKLQQDKGNFIKIDGHSDVIPTDINDNLIVAMDSFLIPPDDKWKEAIDKMNEVPNNYPYEDDRFSILGGYSKMGSKQLENVKKAWDDYYKDREKMRKAMFGEGEKFMNTKEIKIKYHNKDIEKLTYIDGKSDWIDLRAAEDVTLKAGEFKLINLGVSMKLPEGYEAHIVPRSSTFKNFHIIQTNHQAVIDNSYCTDNDVWRYPVYAMEDTEIHFNDRICQFRIVENQPKINFVEVDFLDGIERGGFGSTGKQ